MSSLIFGEYILHSWTVCRFWAAWSNVSKPKTWEGGSGMLMLMINGSGRQWKSLRQKDLIVLSLSDFNIWNKLGKKARLGCCCSHFGDKQLNWTCCSEETPTCVPLPPALSCIISLEAAASGNSRRSCWGNSGSWCQICRRFCSVFQNKLLGTSDFSLPPA